MGMGYDVAPGERLRGESWRWNVNAGKPLQAAAGDQLVLGKRLALNLGCKFDEKQTSFTAVGYYPSVERPFTCGSRISLSVATDQGQMNALFFDVAGSRTPGSPRWTRATPRCPWRRRRSFSTRTGSPW